MSGSFHGPGGNRKNGVLGLKFLPCYVIMNREGRKVRKKAKKGNWSSIREESELKVPSFVFRIESASIVSRVYEFGSAMGLSSASNVSEALKICIFDLRRGQQEGQELDKILFFFPADTQFPSQLSVIGLSEGLITFTRIFSPEAACEVIEAEIHSHIFYEAEPDIWMVMMSVSPLPRGPLKGCHVCPKDIGHNKCCTV
ncbi:hypothetical protein RJ640_012466 [Escallonia rubra]|uniref:CCZ1/INTU/HSP4 first Longin domain-containing protein n=1 Tax=Escallonia rubra TaxID=112253 RepID=A0AA88RL32_9ASTE|nr:hypothetical protein RJ640_012466 [Escallonia rubra]